MLTAKKLAQLFHSTYEELAPYFHYETRLASRKTWEDVPTNNRDLMIATSERVLATLKAAGYLGLEVVVPVARDSDDYDDS